MQDVIDLRTLTRRTQLNSQAMCFFREFDATASFLGVMEKRCVWMIVSLLAAPRTSTKASVGSTLSTSVGHGSVAAIEWLVSPVLDAPIVNPGRLKSSELNGDDEDPFD